MLSLLVTILIVGLIFAVVFWIIGLFPLPAPWGNVLRAIVGLILLIWLISFLLPLAHTGALLR